MRGQKTNALRSHPNPKKGVKMKEKIFKAAVNIKKGAAVILDGDFVLPAPIITPTRKIEPLNLALTSIAMPDRKDIKVRLKTIEIKINEILSIMNKEK